MLISGSDEDKAKVSWVVRNSKELHDAFKHPDLLAQVAQLVFCDRESVEQNREYLISTFVRTYDISVELAERLLEFIIRRDKRYLRPSAMMAGTHFFSNEKKVAGVSKKPEEFYKHLQSQYGKERLGTVYLRIGPSSTKEDVLAWIEVVWDKQVEPLRDAQLNKGRQVREKPKIERDMTIYKLWKEGKKYSEITKLIDGQYDDYLIDSDLRKIVERTKPKTEILADFSQKFMELVPQIKGDKNKKIVMKKIDSNAPKDTLFHLEIVRH